ncbi:MAG: hypothetical protein K0S86_1438 [Geminicoccaceae bacterium]|nr:hypothetical protein [Geminicoccaceae bacterium]
MLTFTLAGALAAALALQPGVTGRLTLVSPKDVAADSQRVLRGARSAQAEFERTRRAHLPINNRGTSGRCDVRVGRLCYWWDEGEWAGPPEPEKTKSARTGLLAKLAAAGDRLPGDSWIVGQRVRYLVEDGRAGDAARVARECRATASWCAALGGFALHAAADFAAADSAFAAALTSMTEEERCRWTDITLYLDGDPLEAYERLACPERGTFEQRFWAVARPLHLLAANDLRTEHFARLTMAEIIRTSRYAHDMSWGNDVRELMLRYGWETGWSREPPSISATASVHVVGHEPTPAFSFVPATDAIESPGSAKASDWELRDRMARTRYAPAWARSVSGLEPQIAFFRRGDSELVVAALDLRRDTLFRRDSIAAALAVAPATAPESVTVVRHALVGRHHVMSATGRWQPLLVSVEARDSSDRRVARTRLVARPPPTPDSGRVTVSDLLLFDDPATLPTSLDEAMRRARGALRVERSEPVGVYWEMYGIAPGGEPLEYTLTVTRVGARWLRRAAEKMGVLDRRAPVRMKWDEPAARPDGVRARALAVDFSTLPEGRYRIDLALEADGQPPAVASRVVEVSDAARR